MPGKARGIMTVRTRLQSAVFATPEDLSLDAFESISMWSLVSLQSTKWICRSLQSWAFWWRKVAEASWVLCTLVQLICWRGPVTVSLIFGAGRTEFLFRGGGGGVPPPLGSNPPWSLAGECDFPVWRVHKNKNTKKNNYTAQLCNPTATRAKKTFDHTQHVVKKHWQRQDDGTRWRDNERQHEEITADKTMRGNVTETRWRGDGR